MTQIQLTYGEKAVGITFNLGANPDVENIKYRFAQVIDTLHDCRLAAKEKVEKEMIELAISASKYACERAVFAVEQYSRKN